jgi:Uma2 family endonuclease
MMRKRLPDEVEEAAMPITEAEFRELSLSEPNQWELHDGIPVRQPVMTFEHYQASWLIGHMIGVQVNLDEYVIRVDAGLVRRSASRYYIPDVMVIPMAEARRLFPEPGIWEVYPGPVSLVVEVWSPSTGRTDLTDKLTEYRRRGDLEIWFLHPYERTLTVWRRQPDGSYEQSTHRGGSVRPATLPGVEIDLDEVFRRMRPSE